MFNVFETDTLMSDEVVEMMSNIPPFDTKQDLTSAIPDAYDRTDFESSFDKVTQRSVTRQATDEEINVAAGTMYRSLDDVGSETSSVTGIQPPRPPPTPGLTDRRLAYIMSHVHGGGETEGNDSSPDSEVDEVDYESESTASRYSMGDDTQQAAQATPDEPPTPIGRRVRLSELMDSPSEPVVMGTPVNARGRFLDDDSWLNTGKGVLSPSIGV
jgi:hypothetical protein